jgi:hypothetical protein
MKFNKRRGAFIAALVTVGALAGSPATAGGAGVLILDASGVDYDAACTANTDLPPPGPDAVGSPGTSYCQDGSGVSTFDGSTEATDIRGVSLGSNAGAFVARCDLDEIVPAGSITPPPLGGLDTPQDGAFSGTSCKVMFQVPARQNNTPTNNVGGGCPRTPTGVIFDQHGHWRDGYHFFIGFNQSWNGTRWIHSVQMGEYDPAPDGGFAFFELAVDNGSGWTPGPLVAISGSTVTITVGSVIVTPDVNCATGVFLSVYARPGDAIRNIKGLSSADITTTLPVTVPVSLVPGATGDITSVGGYTFFSDVTAGNSQNSGTVGSLLQPNIPNLSYTTGVSERNRGGATASNEPGQTTGSTTGDSGGGGSSGTWGSPHCCDPFDTLGEGLACPSPTFGGVLPPNQFLNPNFGCHLDDDNVPVPNAANPAGPWVAVDPGERGTFLPEFWDTNFGFTL